MAMGQKTHTLIAVLCLAAAAPKVAGAQFGATATIEQGLASTQPEDATASGTRIDLTQRPEAIESAQDILPEIPGANVVSLGGPFDFVSLSLRGVDAENTTVLLGELPLSNRDTGAFDFSQIPISAFGSLEVYRGGAPAWYNNGAIGGVVRLIPREDPSSGVGANLGVGSFGTYRAEVAGSANRGRVRSFNNFRYGRTRGDFPFTNDRCTPFDPTDDIELRRENNDAQQYQGLSFTEVDTRRGNVNVALLGTHVERGVPGTGCDPVLQAREARTQFYAGASYNQTGTHGGGKDYELQAVGGGGYIRNRFDDPFGEIGIAGPSSSDDRTANGYARIGTRLEASDNVDWTILATAQYDRFVPEVEPQSVATEPSQRVEGALVLEPRIYGQRGRTMMELRSSIRLGFSQTRVRTSEFGPAVDRTNNTFLPTLRLGAAVGPRPWLTFAASGYTGVRLPTILELFGTRARIKGNPNLEPESGIGGDLSVVMVGSRGVVQGSAEMRGFVSARDDIIIARRNSQDQITFQNEDSARSVGAEARFAGELTPHLTISSTLTGLVARDQNDKQLPSISPFSSLTRIEGHTRSVARGVDDLVLFAQFFYRAGGFTDPANQVPFPDYKPFTIGVYALLLDERLWLAFTVRNLLDDQSFDVLGYPLPGRNFAATVSYRHRFTGQRRSQRSD